MEPSVPIFVVGYGLAAVLLYRAVKQQATFERTLEQQAREAAAHRQPLEVTFGGSWAAAVFLMTSGLFTVAETTAPWAIAGAALAFTVGACFPFVRSTVRLGVDGAGAGTCSKRTTILGCTLSLRRMESCRFELQKTTDSDGDDVCGLVALPIGGSQAPLVLFDGRSFELAWQPAPTSAVINTLAISVARDGPASAGTG